MSEELRTRVSELDAGAVQRRRAALRLLDGRTLPVSVELLCQALTFAVTAAVVARRAHAASAVLEPAVAAGALSQLESFTDIGSAPRSLALAKQLLTEPRPDIVQSAAERSALDQLVYSGEAVRALDAALGWVRRSYEPRSPRQLLVSRVLRVASFSLVALAILGCCVARWFLPTNVAYGKPVTLVSHLGGAPQPATLVDGRRLGRAGPQTGAVPYPWVSIDLRAKHVVDTVKVYALDGTSSDELVPLVLELSEDDKNYREVAVRQKPFVRGRPWLIELAGLPARYVRLKARELQGSLGLAEVEVYGKPVD